VPTKAEDEIFLIRNAIRKAASFSGTIRMQSPIDGVDVELNYSTKLDGEDSWTVAYCQDRDSFLILAPTWTQWLTEKQGTAFMQAWKFPLQAATANQMTRLAEILGNL
jgi:hypothetical protein